MSARWIVSGVVAMALLSNGTVALAADSSASAPQPKVRKLAYYYDGFEQTFQLPVARAADLVVLGRKLSGHRREAANVDDHDQVRLPSTWWQPRLGFRPVTPRQMLDGEGGGAGPIPGKLRLSKLKTQGVSPGFQVKDASGTRFALKFDPPAYPELASGADVVVSYLYWAAGYNVPQNSIVYFKKSDLEVAPGATYKDEAGRQSPLTPELVEHVLAKVHPEPDGSYRAVASRILTGTPLGEWEYRGRRRDDPEDLIPHEFRRELRGLRTIVAWTNNTDCSARNTFDSWVTEGGRSFVRHYLLDFSGALGSSSIGPMTARDGSEHLFDFGAAAASLVTLGLKPPPWESAVDPGLPSAGFIESRVFDPEHWHPFLPNPAFDESTERDLRWGARIVAGFTDEHIRAAVSMGRYSDPRTAEYLTRTLIERRDKIVQRWPGAQAGSVSGLGK